MLAMSAVLVGLGMRLVALVVEGLFDTFEVVIYHSAETYTTLG